MSDRALEKAIGFAKSFGAELILLHIIEDIPAQSTVALANKDFVKAKRSILKQLEQWWDKTSEVKIHEMENENVIASSRCLFGDPAERITRFSKTDKIDLIVMGSRRLKGASKIRHLGS